MEYLLLIFMIGVLTQFISCRKTWIVALLGVAGTAYVLYSSTNKSIVSDDPGVTIHMDVANFE